jgi:hypothetical protein
MKKAKLDMETVEVQSFETTPGNVALPGTVHAAENVTFTVCGSTCIESCCKTALGQD